MSPTLNESTALQRFKRGNVVEIRNEIMFDFYLGLPHIYVPLSISIFTESRSGCMKVVIVGFSFEYHNPASNIFCLENLE